MSSLYDAKKVKILAVLTEKRAEFAPEIPTLQESGYRLPYPGFVGLFAPKGTSDGIIKKLDDVVRNISADEEYKDKSKKLGLQLAYQDTVTFTKSLEQLKEELQVFFKEEGLVK